MLTPKVLLALLYAVSALASNDVRALESAAQTHPTVAELPMADRVVVHKAARKLYLYQRDQIVREFTVRLGLRPEGAKEVEGDYRTPEGRYRLARRNPQSEFFLSILVDYPGPQDIARAKRKRMQPGGAIMIHGMPNTPRKPLDYYQRVDWTDGCIAVSNSDMVEIWLMTRPGLPIDILP